MEGKKPQVTNSMITNYALSSGLNTMSFTVSTLYATMFMTDYLGINPIAMANAMLITRFIDFGISIVSGIIIEKAHMKHGKYLSWIRLLTVTLFLGNTIQMLDTTAFVHHATARLTIVMLAYLLMGGSMNFYVTTRAAILPKFCGADMELRKKFTARQMQFSSAISIIGSAIILPMVTFVGKITGKDSMGYCIVAAIFGALFMVDNILFCRQAAPFDPPETDRDVKKTPTIKQIGASLVTNPQMLVLFFCFSIIGIGNQLYAGVLTYYFRVTGHFSIYTVALTARSILAFAATLVAPVLAKKLGKKSTLVVGWGLMGITGIIIKLFAFTNGHANIVLMIVCVCVMQAATSLYMSFQAIYWLDCGEYGYYKTGIDNRTMAVTVMNWPTKIAFMFGGSLVGWLIAWAGYVAPVDGGMGSFTYMNRFMSAIGLFPALMALAGAVGILFLYKLNDAKAAEYAKANLEREASAGTK